MKKLILLLLLMPSLCWAVNPYIAGIVASGGSLIDDADLLAAWYFENSPNDASGNSIGLTAANSPTYNNTDYKQGSYSTDLEYGDLSYFYSNSSDLDVSGAFSVGGWVKFESLPSKQGMVVRHGSSYGYGIWLRSTGEIEVGISSDGSAWVSQKTGASTVTTGVWCHLVLVYDESYLRVYKDGSEVSTGAFPYAYSSGVYNSPSNFNVGNDDSAHSLDGLMDEVFIFDRALTSTEVATIYNSGLE